jgi:hypothetical protein
MPIGVVFRRSSWFSSSTQRFASKAGVVGSDMDEILAMRDSRAGSGTMPERHSNCLWRGRIDE